MTNIILAFKIENLPSIPMTETIKEKKNFRPQTKTTNLDIVRI